MFLYRTSKAMVWGQAYRPGKVGQAKAKVDAFVGKYFERIEPDGQDGTWLTLKLHWRSTVLPSVQWPEQFLKPENKHSRLIMFILMGDRISFPLGIVFPIPLKDPASYAFLKQFGSDTPFKMSAQHFNIVVPVGKQGKYVVRKPDAEIAVRLREVIL